MPSSQRREAGTRALRTLKVTQRKPVVEASPSAPSAAEAFLNSMKPADLPSELSGLGPEDPRRVRDDVRTKPLTLHDVNQALK